MTVQEMIDLLSKEDPKKTIMVTSARVNIDGAYATGVVGTSEKTVVEYRKREDVIVIHTNLIDKKWAAKTVAKDAGKKWVVYTDMYGVETVACFKKGETWTPDHNLIEDWTEGNIDIMSSPDDEDLEWEVITFDRLGDARQYAERLSIVIGGEFSVKEIK